MPKLRLGLFGLMLLVFLASADLVRSRVRPPEKDAYVLPVIGVTDADSLRVLGILFGSAGATVVLVWHLRTDK